MHFLISLFAVVAVILSVLYKVYIVPFLEFGGVYRTVQPLNVQGCKTVEGLQACEKLVVHPSGLVYLACASSISSRAIWTPAGAALNATAVRAKTLQDYIATYDPELGTITRLDLLGFPDSRGLNVHGMDVVPDARETSVVWIYVVNHRPPLDPTVDAAKVGADSVIEIFKAHVGARTVEWTKTMEDPSIIITPNDVIGGADGQEFWFTNDHHAKVGLMRRIYMILGVKSASVGYCHVLYGCKIAADKLYGPNGIVRVRDGNVWVASTFGGYVTVHEQQADNTLAAVEVIHIGLPIDNLALSDDGSVTVATFTKIFHYIAGALKDPEATSASSIFRISPNTGSTGYFGEKYKVEKIFEEDGSITGSIISTAALRGGRLYLHGINAKRMAICQMPTESMMLR